MHKKTNPKFMRYLCSKSGFLYWLSNKSSPSTINNLASATDSIQNIGGSY